MKRIFTLLLLTLVLPLFLLAAAPTVTASNPLFKNLDGTRFSGEFTKGNGTYRIVVMKEGSPVTGLPQNGKDYTYNEKFGTAGSEFTQPGEFVVMNTAWTSYYPTNLKPGTTYHIAVFEYNGKGTATEYLLLPLTGSVTTVVAPTAPVSSLTSTAQTGNTITLSWAAGNGSGRLVVARKGAAVNALPADLTDYSYGDNNFGNGTKLGVDNFVVYKGTGTSVVVKNLEPNTEYHFSVFEYNGNYSPVYLTPGVSIAVTSHAGPTIAAKSIGLNYVEGNRFTVNCTVGNGTRRLFVMKKGSAVTAIPGNGVAYPANAVFGTAGTEIAPGEFVVGDIAASGVAVTNLEAGTTYHFRVYEFDVDRAGNTYYLTSTYAVGSGSTPSAPTTVATNIKVASMTGTGATISFTNGNGNWRMVVMREAAPVDAIPVNFIQYGGNSAFGSGTQIAPGNYVIHGLMNGTQFSVSNLKPGTAYHVAIYEFNGYNYPVYLQTPATFSFVMPAEPTTPSKSPWTALRDGNAFRLVWTNGSGARRLLIGRKGQAVTSQPVDGTSYTANARFGSGHQMAPGEFVLYDGDYNSVDLAGLEIGTTYHFALFEYNNNSEGKPDYLVSSYMSAQASTFGWPTVQTILTGVSNIQASQATINFTPGNGEKRLFLMREGAPVSAVPQDEIKYAYNATFGTATTHMGDGNYAVVLSGDHWPTTVNGLKPLTTYHISVHEFNGDKGPAYLKSNPATYSFTTPDVPGATVPTVAASSALFSGVEGNKLTLKWTSGNGAKRIVVMRQGSAVAFTPASATNYTANAAFGLGADLGGGQYLVYNGNGSTVDITNLFPSTTYYFAVYEYNGTGDMIRYLTTQFLTTSGSTLLPPATPSGDVQAVTGSGSITFNWSAGSGTGRLLVLKEESAVTALPADLSVYPANAVFKSGSQLALGEYVVFAGTANSVTVTGLANKTYHYRLFEYNGATAPVYNTTANVSGSAVMSTPLPVTLVHFSARAKEGVVVISWATAQEVDNEAFMIERSVDGIRFEAVQRIAGKGNSYTRQDYTCTDGQLPQAERVYYRLKQVDIDGGFSYSGVVTVTLQSTGSGFAVYPNPIGSQFRVALPAGASEGTLHIFDARGVLLSTQKLTGPALINSSRWSAGTYYLQLRSGGRLHQQTIVKQ